MSQLQAKLGKSNDVSNLLFLALENLGYSNERIIRYSFLIEEALLKWKEYGLSDNELTFKKTERKNEIVFDWVLVGERCDPFHIDTNELELNPIERMDDLLQSGVGTELQYKYRNGKNNITLTLPLGAPEKKLFNRNLLSLAIPIGFQALLVSLANFIGSFLLGFVDANAMSAVSQLSQFIQLHSYLISACEVAATIMISKAWGVRNRNAISFIVGAGLKFALFCSMLFFLLSFLLPDKLMSFYANIPEIAVHGIVYLKIISFSFFVSALYRISYCLLRATGKAKKCLLYSVVGCVVNILLSVLLVFGIGGLPAMGAKGAAIATLASGLVQLVLVVVEIMKSRGLSVTLRNDHVVMKDYFKSFYSVAVWYLVVGLVENVIAVAFGQMQADVIAANAFVSNIVCLFVNLSIGFGSGCEILMGNCLGKGKRNEAWDMSKMMLSTGMKFSILSAVALFLLGVAVSFLPLDLNEGARHYFYIILVVSSINLFFDSMNTVFNHGMLFPGGDTKGVMLIDFVVRWGFFVPIALLGTYIISVPVIAMIVILKLNEVVPHAFLYKRYKRAIWLKERAKVTSSAK